MKERVGGVMISFTTTPTRLPFIAATCKSLLSQTMRPGRICLILSQDQIKSADVPSFLTACDFIEILWIPIDLGPAKKLLPTLKISDFNELIIVVDDDQVYPSRLVENYHEWATKLPKHALGMLGWEVPKSLKHEDRKTKRGAAVRILDFETKKKKPSSVDVMQGGSSYAVRKSFFREEVYNIPQEAFYVDDIWIAGQLARNGIPRSIIPGAFEFCRIESLGIPSQSALSKTHNRDNQNNNLMYEYFKAYWGYESHQMGKEV